MENKKPGRLSSVLTVTAGLLGYLGTAAYALIKDNMIVGCAFIIFTFAAVAIMVTANKAKDRKATERLLKYGDEPVLTFGSLAFPEDPESRLAALKIVAGEENAASIMKQELSGAELLEAVYDRGRLIKLGKDFTARQLTDGINALLKSSGLSGRSPGLIENDIVSDENEFARTRRADGLDTRIYDLNAAAYLLRQKGIEPSLAYPLTPPITVNNQPEYLYITLVPTEEMYELCRLCDREFPCVPCGADTEATEVPE